LDKTLTIVIGVNTFADSQLDRVNAITAKLATILSNVEVENDQYTTTISLPNLLFVYGDFEAVNIPVLSSISGNVVLN